MKKSEAKEKIYKIAEEKNKIVPGLRVNLIRLSKGTIQQMLNGGTRSNDFNFSLKLSRDGELACTKHPTSVVPSIGTGGNILISIRQPKKAANNVNDSANYNLRQRKPKPVPCIRSKPVQCTTISELGVSVRKIKLWADCKRQMNRFKIVEVCFVFA